MNNSFGKRLGRVWSQYSYIFVLLIIMIGYAFTIQSNGNTFKFSHIAAILGSQNTCIVGTIALGMAFVIITGQIDLSVGSSLVLCTGVTIVVFNMTDSIVLMILAALVTGALCGLINGLLVGLGKMPPFVVTLGTMLIYRSLTLSVVRKIDPAISGSSSSQFAMISKKVNYNFLRMKFGTGKLKFGTFSIPAGRYRADHCLPENQVRQERLCSRLQRKKCPSGGHQCHLGKDFRVCPHRRAGRHCFYSSGMQNR